MLLQRLHRLPTVLTYYARFESGHSRNIPQRHMARAEGQAQRFAETNAAKPSRRAPKTAKLRLDDLCFQQYPELSRGAILSWIAQGKVSINNAVIDKAGTQVQATASVQLTAKQDKYVCRAGHKLEAALDHFRIDVTGKRILDSGISTGGFTDCLLQRGAAAVIGVDVGYGQVAERVRTDSRVTVMERTNVRHLSLSELPNSLPVDMATLDLSFISVLKVVEPVQALMAPHACLVVLIKPQFEAARHQVQPGGVVKEPAVHAEVIARVTAGIEALGFAGQGCIASPLPGAVSGNQEFLAAFVR